MRNRQTRTVWRWPLAWQLLITLVLLSGCGWFGFGGDDPIEPGSVEQVNTVELTLMSGSSSAQLEKELIRQFEETHAGLEIERKTLSNWPQIYLKDDEPPDLMNVWTGSWLNTGLEEGLIADLTDVWEQGELGDSYSAQLQALTEQGGRQYYLPTGYDWRAIYYNRELFNTYGLQPPQTWDELMVVADTLVANGEIPFALNTRNDWLAAMWFDYINIRLNGPEFQGALIRGEESFTDGRVQEVFVVWANMFEKGYFGTDIGSWTGLASLTAIIRGDKDQPLTRDKAVMTLSASLDLNDLPSIFQDELDFFRFPIIDDSMPLGEVVNANGLIVPANAPNRQDALQFVSYMAQPETQAFAAQFLGPESNFVPAGSYDFDQLPLSTQQGTMLIERAEHVVLPYMWSVPTDVRIAMEQSIARFLRRAGKDEPIDYDEIIDPLEEARIKALDQGKYFN